MFKSIFSTLAKLLVSLIPGDEILFALDQKQIELCVSNDFERLSHLRLIRPFRLTQEEAYFLAN
jgi:hypothetical protein